MNALAVGATYYVLDYLYVDASIGQASLTYTSEVNGEEREGQTELGPFFMVSGGAEYPISDHWGLGGALRFFYAAPKEDDELFGDVSYEGRGMALVFSATYY